MIVIDDAKQNENETERMGEKGMEIEQPEKKWRTGKIIISMVLFTYVCHITRSSCYLAA